MENFQVPFREISGLSTPATSVPVEAEEYLHPHRMIIIKRTECTESFFMPAGFR
jgi:hypothetical protein